MFNCHQVKKNGQKSQTRRAIDVPIESRERACVIYIYILENPRLSNLVYVAASKKTSGKENV